MIKVCVIGINGMAGHMVSSFLKLGDNFEVWGVARGSSDIKNTKDIDVRDSKKLHDFLVAHSFNYVINCVGILNESVEKNLENSVWINSYFPHCVQGLFKYLVKGFMFGDRFL